MYEFMTGIKYLNFIADIFGIGAEERVQRINKYADMFELTASLAQPVSSYSHGMKQKLAVIAAWIHSPKLIIMDEPFVGLDPKAAHTLKGLMREVCNDGGAIFFRPMCLKLRKSFVIRLRSSKAADSSVPEPWTRSKAMKVLNPFFSSLKPNKLRRRTYA